MWSALESEEAHQEVLKGLCGLEETVCEKLDMVNLKAVSRNDYVLEEVRTFSALGKDTQDLSKETGKAVKGLTTTAVAKSAALEKSVGELSSRPPQDVLE